MRTLFFGTGTRKLYGAYHPASQAAPVGARSQGVVLCYPGVQEYNVSHAAFRKLATMLARAGVHVLRFDYFGTGDSAGGMHEGLPDDWATDIRTAVTELADIAGIRAISLAGFRLGATLAAKVVSEGLQVSDLVLWDPVVSGRDYIAELERRDRQQNLVLLHPTSRFERRKEEMLGYPFPAALRSSLGRLDLRSLAVASAKRVVLMVTEEVPAHGELRAALGATREVTYAFVTENAEATNKGAREDVLLAAKVLTAIKDELVGAPS